MIEQKSLIESIENEFGEEVGEKVREKLAYESNIYVLYIASVSKVTERGLQIGFASYHARFPDRTYEQYLKYKKNFDEDKFNYDIEPQGYFIDEKTAFEYAEANMGDINEAGSFPYVIISEMPLNRVYPTCNTREHRLFVFDDETRKYKEIAWDYNEETEFLQRRGDHCVF